MEKKLKRLTITIIILLYMSSCSIGNDNECVSIEVEDFKGLIINGKERTIEALAETSVDDSIDPRIFGTWMDVDGKDDSSITGDTYIFFKDGTYIKLYRLYVGEGLIENGTYRTTDNSIYLYKNSKEYRYYYVIENAVMDMRYETWESGVILQKIGE